LKLPKVDDRLLTWARLPGPRKVLIAARRRLEAGHGLGRSPLRVDLSPGERSEIGQLLGMSWERSGRAVGAKALAVAVENYGTTVTGLLTATGDPVRDLRAAKEGALKSAAAERMRAAGALHDVGVPATIASAWLDRRGLPAAGSGQLLDLAERCARIWSALPQRESGRMLLTVLAASALDDPHALDRGSSTATAVLRLLGHEPPNSAEAWRMAWEEHGIDCDPVSSRVLVLNLPITGDAPCARLAQAAGPEPLWLTLRSVTGSFQMAVPASDVYVCENPSVLIAAADELGEYSHPLVCTNGRPSAAALRLLTGLAESGAAIHVRADDDAAGQAIVATVRRAIPDAELWRFEARPTDLPRYEEQDLPLLLHDLRRPNT
jgi:uncharacterized protein (TIGR02679 family)